MQELDIFVYSPSNIAKDQDPYDIVKKVLDHPNMFPIQTFLLVIYFDSHM